MLFLPNSPFVYYRLQVAIRSRRQVELRALAVHAAAVMLRVCRLPAVSKVHMLREKTSERVESAKFKSMADLIAGLEGTTPFYRCLVANNGLAAVKGIRSIQTWLFEHVGDADALQFEVMATPEDLGVNAEFIKLSHHHVEVPGGTNANNYANVDLIVNTALQQKCDCVYPGWGHASENPALPRQLLATRTCTFLGPGEGAMFALGDKIASSIIAQSLDVPTVPWSGDHLRVAKGTLNIEPQVYKQAYVDTPEECVEVVKRVGLPVMLKASEGGGGKGIRKVTSMEEVVDKYLAVKEEVKGCHIFVMRMLENVRHLEVQLLADKYGACIAVRTRDCSVQRRHQKIIEEGPVVGVDPAIVEHMEQSAIRLAKAVGYCGLGTVEYMYDKDSGKYCFLELNPRIQVEHPVSELISGVNLPAALLCTGMGVPLHRIPEVRMYYGEEPYGKTPINFETQKSNPAKGHAIAVRITAEDADNGFRPTSGSIDEISFRNSRDCWGYFSVAGGGGVHQFADSQFGHIFATGATREEARRSMVLALRNVTVRGEIRTSTAYVIELLEMREFRECDVNTAWLDGLIATRSPHPKQADVHPALAAAAVYRMLRFLDTNAERYEAFLKAGHTPSTDYLIGQRSDTFVLQSNKYVVDCGRVAQNEYMLSLNGDVLSVNCRVMGPGALQLTVCGRNIVAYCEEEPSAIRVTINGRSVLFTGDADPTKLRSAVPGRLVRFLVPDGGHVTEGAPYCEVEVMKMILVLNSTVAGTVHLRAAAGSTLTNGKLLAEVDPDDPSSVARATLDDNPWPAAMHEAQTAASTGREQLDAVSRARSAVDTLWNLIQGYHCSAVPLQLRLKAALNGLASLCLSSVSIASLNRPFVDCESASSPGREGEGRRESPNGKLRAVFSAIVDKFLAVESWFDGRTRAEAIEKLKEQHGDDAKPVFAMDFAHAQQHRIDVVKSLLTYIDRDEPLMHACSSVLDRVVTLQSAADYGSVLLHARYLVRKCSVPSFDERKAALIRRIENEDVGEIAAVSVPLNLLCAALFDRTNPNIAPPLLELIARRFYYGVGAVSNVDVVRGDGSATAGTWHATWRFVKDGGDPLPTNSPVSPGTVRLRSGMGTLKVFVDERAMESGLEHFVTDGIAASTASGSAATLYVFFGNRNDMAAEDIAALCADALAPHTTALASSTVERITFTAFNHSTTEPNMFTFHRDGTSQPFVSEDLLLRDTFPTIAHRLELGRLRNYDISMYPTPNRKVHIYLAAPRGTAGAVTKGVARRLFVRVYYTPGDLGMAPWASMTDEDCGHVMNMIESAVELAQSDTKAIGTTVYNHLFFHLIEVTFDLKELPRQLRALSRSFAGTMFRMGFREVELKFHAKVGDAHVPFRVFLTNHTMHSLSIDSYVEVDDGKGGIVLQRAKFSDDIVNTPGSPVRVMRRWGGDTASSNDLAAYEGAEDNDAAGDRETDQRWALLKEMLPPRMHEPFSATESSVGSHDGGAYAPLSNTQLRRLQAQMSATTFVFDWPTLFDAAIRKDWQKMCRARSLADSVVPAKPAECVQLHYNATSRTLSPATEGASASGMIVWRMTLRSPAYFDVRSGTAGARDVVVVANDITVQSGSFSVAEDVVFEAASVYSREHALAFVYLSANSGARLGLVNEVKQCFRVALRGDALDYIYLTPEDHKKLTDAGVKLHCETVQADGETRHKILDVIGSDKEYIGVENLRGSALIAGQMSLNYAKIPTISVVSGRSVGIGAYLVRLGRRVVQTKNSPIILTGAHAINRLLGKEVYSSNQQLGGNQIMQPNGVTHWPAEDDLDGVRVTLRWLDFVPAKTEEFSYVPRKLTMPIQDPVDRDVTFMPAMAAPYDPRCLVEGTDGDQPTLGLFDKGSWMEAMADWARTVVVGRATLGGIASGVIIVETRSVRKFDPADPADPASTASFVSQAGQVWFPDSARKTADALEDFHRERLPCFILANWRGFSGGMRDMFDEVMKFGASIVDNLRVYTAPVFIYIPPFGELRGGAWVVVDPVINHNGCVTMYADHNARGGILEPAGIVEIKFRDADVVACMRRNTPQLKDLDAAAARKQEEALRPLYNDVAVHFADLHDTPGRMHAKECIAEIVPWKQARRVFHAKLVRKLIELERASRLSEAATPGAVSLVEGIAALRVLSDRENVKWHDDKAFSEWAASKRAADAIATECAARRTKRVVAELAAATSRTGSSEEELVMACRELLMQSSADVRNAMRKAAGQLQQ